MKTINNFDAINFWKDDFSPFQRTVVQVLQKDNCRVVHLLTSPQVGKSYFAYRDLFLNIFKGWDSPNPEGRMQDEVFFIVIPLEKDIRKFLAEQLPKGFGVNNKDRFAGSIEDIRIPICIGEKDGKPMTRLQKIVKSKHTTNELSFTFFNNCKLLCFSSSNAAQHLNGYTFKKGVYDEYSKHIQDTTHVAAARLLHKNGTLLTVTTLNEDDPANWYYYEVIKPFVATSRLISERNLPIWTGLDIYKKEADLDKEINIGNNVFKKINIKELNYLCIGSFETVYPYIHNSEKVYRGVIAMKENGQITQQNYRNLFCCDVSVDENRFLSNYSPTVNHIYLGNTDVNLLVSKQVLGYDHGTGKTDRHSGIGWARVGVIWDKDRPNFEQYIVLESGLLSGEFASIDYLIKFFSKYPYWIFCDNSIFRDSAFGKRTIDFFPNILKRRMKPSSMNGLRNDSRERIAFWQKGLSLSLSPKFAEKQAQKRGEPFDTEEYIEYKNPLDKNKFGCQIYIAQDDEKPYLNERLIWEMLNYKKVYKNGKIQEETRAKVDVWDAVSYAIVGIQDWRKNLLENKADPAVLVNNSEQKYKQKIYRPIPFSKNNNLIINSFHLNNNFSSF